MSAPVRRRRPSWAVSAILAAAVASSLGACRDHQEVIHSNPWGVDGQVPEEHWPPVNVVLPR